MTWHEAIEGLERQVADWAPEGIEVRTESWSEDDTVNVLVLHRGDGRRATLEPASWKVDEVPTAVDLYNGRGSRMRLQGPDAQGGWKILTSDLIDLRVTWDRKGFGAALDMLLAA